MRLASVQQETMQDATTNKKAARRVYQCRKCGLPAKGHDCPYKSVAQQKKQPLYAKKKSAAPPSKKRQRSRLITSNTSKVASVAKRDDESDDDEWAHDDEAAPSRAKSSARTRQKSTKQKSKHSATNITEVTMVAHIFEDQLQDYRREHDADDALTAGEDAFLVQWSKLGREKLQEQNGAVAENIQLVMDRRQVGKRIHKERDALVGLKSKTRRLEAESVQAEQQLAASRLQKSTAVSASRFLDALDQLQT